MGGAITFAGNLTLDGGGNPEAIFVIKASGALDAAASTRVSLTNGASARNVFWVSEGAIGIGASTSMPGTILSHGAAIAIGVSYTLSGRLFTTGGAISIGSSTVDLPTQASIINFRTLNPFVIYSGTGAVTNTGASVYNGNISTQLGAISGFESASLTGTIFPSGSSSVITQLNPMATFSLYQNDQLITNSSRTMSFDGPIPIVSLLGISTLLAGQPIDVRWKMSTKVGYVDKRILTMLKIGN